MADLRQITHWRAPTSMGGHYERLLAAIGTERFGPTVRGSVLSLTAGARRIYLFEATDREHTSLHYFSGEPRLAELLPAYQRWYLARDPLGDAFSAAPHSSNVAMQRVRPADIASPGFRRRFFDDAGIVERISMVQRGADAWRGMNIVRHAADGLCSDDELSSLIGLACLVLPMLPLNRSRTAGVRPVSVTQLETRFAERYPCLTRRERQVCARAAMGMSVEATARDLRIGKTSVLTYRQRAYQRLGVASPFELCALVAH
ncbi:MAG TPA: helix-turn-helix transcriptional regulator [Gammaproteobacteria bacterium]|nr:helix-turn-helix transcriptional regulator [Gammaproteobacteria bacterium]